MNKKTLMEYAVKVINKKKLTEVGLRRGAERRRRPVSSRRRSPF